MLVTMTEAMMQAALPTTESCEVCGRRPTRQVTVSRNVGLLVARREYHISRTLCRSHGTQLCLRWTGRTLIQGWWGMISLVVNALTVVLNLAELVRVLRMPSPETLPSAPPPG